MNRKKGLIQTIVDPEVVELVEIAAKAENIKVAAWVRRLIVKELAYDRPCMCEKARAVAERRGRATACLECGLVHGITQKG